MKPNMKKTILLFAAFVSLTFQNHAQTVTDIDGNTYTTVTIGTQTWLGQNLNVSRYNNGDSIPNITNDTTWSNLTTGAYCDYNNIPGNSTIYGKLYNHYALTDPRNLCPIGWHVSTEDEWITLVAYLGGETVAGGKLKETGTTHWLYFNIGATNETGFTALPGGDRTYDGLFTKLGEVGTWWNSTAYPGTPNYSMNWMIGNFGGDIGEEGSINTYGYSVRCVSNISGIEQKTHKARIEMYPNPACDRITVDGAAENNLKIAIYNVFGELMLQRELNYQINEIDISKLPAGMYIIKVSNDYLTEQKIIIKE